jgi:hypothetical protein
MFGKPKDLPWAVAPLFIGRKLLGYIAADQKLSRRPITTWELSSLGVFGTIAAQALTAAKSATETRDRYFPGMRRRK